MVDSCRAEALGNASDADDDQWTHGDLIQRLARDEAWGRVAEVAWVRAVGSGDVDLLLETIDQYPETRGFLQQVLDGLARDTGTTNPHPDAGELIRRIQASAQRLDAARLDKRELLSLAEDAQRLAEVAEANNLRGRAIKRQMGQLKEWRNRHRRGVADTRVVSASIAALKQHIERGAVTSEGVDTVLGLVEHFISVVERRREAREDIARALREGTRLSVAAETLDSLGAELEELEATIVNWLSHPPSPDPNVGEAPRNAMQPSGPQPDELKTALPEAVKPSDDGPLRNEQVGSLATAGDPGIVAPSPPEERESPEDESGPPAVDAADGTGVPATSGAETGSPGDQNDRAVADPTDSTGGTGADIDHDTQAALDEEIATAIDRGHLGLAYHLACSTPEVQLSVELVKLMACNYVTDELAPIGAELPRIADSLLAQAKLRVHTGNARVASRDFEVLATCAALYPALVAPGGPVAQLLAVMEPGLGDMPSLRSLAKATSDVSMTGVDLPRSLLRDDNPVATWREAEASLRSETTSWISSERQSTLRFHAATRVWRRLLEVGEPDAGRASLGYVFRLLENPTEEIDAGGLAQALEYWRANRDKEIDRIDRELRGSAALRKIEGSARSTLRGKVDLALAFADRWLSLIREQPAKQVKFHTEQASRLRATLDEHLAQALSEVRETTVQRGAVALLKRYGSLFDKATESSRQPIGFVELLHGDLLADPDIAFDELGQPTEFPLPSSALRRLVESPLEFAHAAVDRAQRGDFTNAALAISFAERTGRIDEDEADRSRSIIDEHRARFGRTFNNRFKETSAGLDAAYADGTLTFETYDEQRARISDLVPSDGLYALQLAALDEVEDTIDAAKTSRLDAIRRTLAGLTLPLDAQGRIDSVVNAGQLQIAEDFVERLERGDALPGIEPQRDRPFDRFFPHFVAEFSLFGRRDEDGIAHVRQAIENGGSNNLINTNKLSDDASRDGIALLDAWVALRDSPTSIRLLEPLMAAVGFEGTTVKGNPTHTPSGHTVFSLRAAPIADRGIACLPDFGSRANGNYKLFTVRDRATGEAVIREAGERHVSDSPPNIVVFVGVLDGESRRMLARDFGSGEYHTTLVLDEALVAFLAAWPENRLAAFFDAASPFAFSQPYDPDSPELPPEMFFGRKAARDAIIAMSGDLTHFVYGGRRLGKTTLLADIAREYRAWAKNEPRQLVLLVNLKGSGIGENRPTGDLWAFFASRLAEYDVLQPRTVRPDSISRSIKGWLKEAEGRRILLLVDEADAFLEAERLPEQAYRVLDEIKVLMEETERRFKVVFAGLHNVQRAAKDPNTPFAHLGEAVRIGPMLPETDGDEIQNLIRSPLEALGYRFVSNDSIIRIAAETNYYPALAQQFCKELLRTMREAADTSIEQGPPFAIHPDIIDSVFNARETRNRVRNLFSWTIQLDPRYEFLTYLIAQRSFENEDGRPQAMRISDIREAALRDWPEGFAHDSSFWMFEVVLDEMVGLGVLRESSDQYAIRTRNLRMLLGNDEEIERRLADARARRAPPLFEPPQFRYTLDDETPSSLSAHQEKRLFSDRNTVGLVFGTRLGGLDRVCESIQKAAEGPNGSLLFSGDLIEPDALRATLRQVSRSRRPGTEVVLVDMREAWVQEAFDHALSSVENQEGQTRIVRPVFLCGPSVAWNRLFDESRMANGTALRDVWLGPCARDFTRTWLTARESRAYASLESTDDPVDLPWPVTVAAAVKYNRLESIDKVVEASLKDGSGHDVSDILISEDAIIAFRLMSELAGDPLTADQLSEFAREEGASMSPDDALRFFAWADRLGVLCRTGESCRLDSTYAMGLARALGV